MDKIIGFIALIARYFVPVNPALHYDRYQLWRHPWRYLAVNAATVAVWDLLLRLAAPDPEPLALVFRALIFLNACVVFACAAALVLPRFGIGPD